MAATLQIVFDGAKAAKALTGFTGSMSKKFERAVARTALAGGAEIKRRGDVDISKAGKFSARWPAAFVVDPQSQGPQATIKVGFNNSIPYAAIHEFGGTIRGKPLLWIPLSFAHVPKDTPARSFPGGLFGVVRPGKNPLLFSATSKEPKYVGVLSVTLRARFHIRSIVANVVRTQFAKMFFGFIKGSG
jgi:hypothetical protein